MSHFELALTAAMVLGGALLVFGVPRAVRKRRLMAAFQLTVTGLLFVLVSLIILLLSAGVKGYRALTREELAATVYVRPLARQKFEARIVVPGGYDTVFTLAGDELYVDARILKWKPALNLLGVHTWYRLDRISGRYRDIGDERTMERTVYSMSPIKPWDPFYLRTKLRFLAPIIDASYGSATFTSVDGPGAVKVLVTTSGLIARPE